MQWMSNSNFEAICGNFQEWPESALASGVLYDTQGRFFRVTFGEFGGGFFVRTLSAFMQLSAYPDFLRVIFWEARRVNANFPVGF